LLFAKNSVQCAHQGFTSLSIRMLRSGKPVAALTSVVTLGSFEWLSKGSALVTWQEMVPITLVGLLLFGILLGNPLVDPHTNFGGALEYTP
jgi:hypothetical protein